MRLLALLLITTFTSLPVVSHADNTPTAAAQAREQREARAREYARKQFEAIEARVDASVKENEAFMDRTREANAEALASGQEAAEAYAENNPVSGYPNTEVRVQETWVWDEALGDQRLEWQYRLVYKDSLGNAQYEAYFDYEGNVTTELRESPWRIANQRVEDALGDENDGPFQVAWTFSEDNEGREYPESVIVQAPGLINRVQMKLNEFGEPYFWDIKDADGEQQRYGHGTQKPTYADEGAPLGSITPPRPITGTCEECRALLNARNDLLHSMVPLANRINDLAGQHTRLNEFARTEEAHVQSFGRLRALHEHNMKRYRALKARFDEADAAWRACEDACKKPMAGASSPAFNTMGSPLGVTVVQDSSKQCTFGDPDGPSTAQATPAGPADSAANSAAPSTGMATNSGSAPGNGMNDSPAGATASTSASTPSDAPGSSATPSGSASEGGSQTSQLPGQLPNSTSGSENGTGGTNGESDEYDYYSFTLPEGAGNEGDGNNEQEDSQPTETAPPEEEEPKSQPRKKVIKASALTMASGALVSGRTSQLIALQPHSVNDVDLPTDSCGTSDCDWWKMEDSCGESWYCDEATASAENTCSGSTCDDDDDDDDYDYFDCSGSGCGWDAGYDQDPVRCLTGADGTCSLTINPAQQQAGNYYLVVDGFSEANSPTNYSLDVNVIDSEGITVESRGGDLSSLPEQYQHYVQDSVTVGDNTWHTLLYPQEEATAVRAALSALSGFGLIAIDPCWIKWKAPNDPYYQSSNTWDQGYADQWALHRVGFGPKGENAWELLGDDAAEVTVAVIDTGIDWNHRDLAWRNLWMNTKEIPDNGKDDDGNGYIDDRIGWDFWAGDNRPWDEDGHGTLLAGIIAARSDNNTGIAGINPKARIMPLRALNAFGHTRASYVARALVYAVDNGARVVNLSVGGPGESAVFRAAVDYAEANGVLVVAAAGNEAAELSDILPGAHNNVLTVAALDYEDKRAAFSNYGDAVDIAAPGIDILSLRARFTDTMLGLEGIEYTPGEATVGADKRYYRVGGTSFASPFVTGIASLLLSNDPSLEAQDLRRILQHSAQDVTEPGWDQLTGYGRVDALAALRADRDYFIEAQINAIEVEQRSDGVFVVVNGSARADEFAEADILLGAGENPKRWRRVTTLKSALAKGELAAIPAAVLQGGPKTFTVRLVVKHKDGTSREARFGLNLG